MRRKAVILHTQGAGALLKPNPMSPLLEAAQTKMPAAQPEIAPERIDGSSSLRRAALAPD